MPPFPALFAPALIGVAPSDAPGEARNLAPVASDAMWDCLMHLVAACAAGTSVAVFRRVVVLNGLLPDLRRHEWFAGHALVAGLPPRVPVRA